MIGHYAQIHPLTPTVTTNPALPPLPHYRLRHCHRCYRDIEYGMTCEDYESGWTEANWIDIDTNKFGQVFGYIASLTSTLFLYVF